MTEMWGWIEGGAQNYIRFAQHQIKTHWLETAMVGESYNQLRLAIAQLLQIKGTRFKRFFDLDDTTEGILCQLDDFGYVAATDYVNRTVDKLQADIA
jgi:hypothetical protein